LPADPVEVAAPAVDALPLPVLPPPVPPPPPPEPVPPPVVEVVALVELVEVVEEVVVPVAGVEVAVDEFCMLGSATAPPPVGNPLLRVALPTFPVVGVALCATAVETRPIDSRKANPKLRIMAGYIMCHCSLCRERPDQNRVTCRPIRARLGPQFA
jgi:hypothetical protein